MRDITVRKAREVAISKRAETDDLTGVLNRAGFHQRLNLAIETSEEPFSLALIDVDRFKSINDTYGHPVGDAALIEIVRRMKTGTRKGDVVGRLGGDEFAILFRCEMAKAETICKRITGLVSTDPIHANDNVLLLTSISCGVAQFARACRANSWSMLPTWRSTRPRIQDETASRPSPDRASGIKRGPSPSPSAKPQAEP
jgi:diguanylate cyclase (GGDEF)-like protein